MKTCSIVSGLLLLGAAAQAQLITYTAILSGAAEAPANNSGGAGFATVAYDSAAHTLQVDVLFAGLTGNTTAAHIHAPTAVAGTGTAGVATQTPTFADFPLGVNHGNYSHLFDLTLSPSFNASFINANGGTVGSAESVLAAAMADGKAYVNVHSSAFPGGEIRGFLTVVPEPSTVSLLIVGAGLLLHRASRRRS